MDLIKKKEQELSELKQMFEKEQHALALNRAFDLKLDFFNPNKIKTLEVVTDNDFNPNIFKEKTLYKIIFNDSSSIYGVYDFKDKCVRHFVSPLNSSFRHQMYSVGDMFNIWHETGFGDNNYSLVDFLSSNFSVTNAVDYANFLKNLELFVLTYLNVKRSFSLSLFSKCFNSFQ